MRAVRTIVAVLFAATITVTGCTTAPPYADQPSPPPPGPDTTQGAPPPTHRADFVPIDHTRVDRDRQALIYAAVLRQYLTSGGGHDSGDAGFGGQQFPRIFVLNHAGAGTGAPGHKAPGGGPIPAAVRRVITRSLADVAPLTFVPFGDALSHIAFPYVFLDATYVKARVDSRVVSRAAVIATGVTADGGREVLGCEVGDSEDGAFWTAFLRSLKARGLGGVQLVVSDAHTGLKQAIAAVLAGACWQRCRVHFLRNALARVPKASAEMVAVTIRTIFAQLTPAEVADQVDKVAATLQLRFPAVAALLAEAKEDLTAFRHFPVAHWRKLWSTNPLERLNKELKRRTNVVGIFPDDAAVTRLATAVLIETHDEWQIADRRYLSEGSMALLDPISHDGGQPKEVRRATAELVAT